MKGTNGFLFPAGGGIHYVGYVFLSWINWWRQEHTANIPQYILTYDQIRECEYGHGTRGRVASRLGYK